MATRYKKKAVIKGMKNAFRNNTRATISRFSGAKRLARMAKTTQMEKRKTTGDKN